MSRKQLGYSFAIPAVLLILLGVGLMAFRSTDDGPSVITGTVTRGDVAQVIAATGTLEAVTTVEVGTQVSGTVKDLMVDFNDIVREGQVLARLDPSLLQAAVDQAAASLLKAEADAQRTKVTLEDAQTTLARTKALAARGIVAGADLDSAEIAARSAEASLASSNASVSQARATLSQAKVNLAHSVITSPINGIVISRSVDAGQTVAASMSAPTLYILAADLTQMRVIAKFDESDISKIQPGMAATFRVDAYAGETFDGRVSQVRLQGESVSNVVTYTTVIDVANPELKLKPGMTANVSLTVARSEGTLRVPNQALRFKPTTDQLTELGITDSKIVSAATAKPASGRPKGVGTVWRYNGRTIEPVTVQVGIADALVTAISASDLKVDDQLVTLFAAAGTSTTTAKATTKTNATSNPLMGGGGPGPMGPPPR